MGTTMSMDVSASCVGTSTSETDASSSPLLLPMLTPAPMLHEVRSFEDKLRLETILIPEDLTDIHIESKATVAGDIGPGAIAPLSPVECSTTNTPIVENAQYGRGKHWKRNLKKKQTAHSTATNTNTNTSVKTERTLEERREQVRPIIDKLTELQMNISYPAIRELYKQLNHFVKTGEDAKIKIAFPEFSRKIKGELTNATHKSCWVKLEME
jgi:hypothetical protein